MILKTSIGDIVVRKNDAPYDYNFVSLAKEGKTFSVSDRYKIVIPVEKNENNIIECFIDVKPSIEIEMGRNSGQNLAAVTLKTESHLLTIGVRENDYPDTVEYLENDNGLRKHTIIADNLEEVIFFVAWKKNANQMFHDNDTWFAADPTLF